MEDALPGLSLSKQIYSYIWDENENVKEKIHNIRHDDYDKDLKPPRPLPFLRSMESKSSKAPKQTETPTRRTKPVDPITVESKRSKTEAGSSRLEY